MPERYQISRGEEDLNTGGPCHPFGHGALRLLHTRRVLHLTEIHYRNMLRKQLR